MWIGLLWYFNFVQIPSMPSIPDEQKPAIGKVIAPKALFWFRWAALGTIITGLIVSYLQGYVHQAMILGIGSGDPKTTAIGIGMWLGIIMAYNVWFVIWPNQKKALGIIETDSEEKAKSAKQQCCSQEQTPFYLSLCFYRWLQHKIFIKEQFFSSCFSRVL